MNDYSGGIRFLLIPCSLYPACSCLSRCSHRRLAFRQACSGSQYLL